MLGVADGEGNANVAYRLEAPAAGVLTLKMNCRMASQLQYRAMFGSHHKKKIHKKEKFHAGKRGSQLGAAARDRIFVRSRRPAGGVRTEL